MIKTELSVGTVQQARRSLGMTQQEFAHRLGVAVSTVARWETGVSRPSRMAMKLITLLRSEPEEVDTE